MRLHLVYGIAPAVKWNQSPFKATSFADIAEHHYTDNYAVAADDLIVSHSMGFKTASEKICRLVVALDPVKGFWPFGSLTVKSPTIQYRSWWPLLSSVKGPVIETNKTGVAHWNQPKDLSATVAARIKKFLETGK